MARRAEPSRPQAAHRKLIEFDDETWHALNVLARDTASSFQELADEAIRDLLRKHGRPTDLRAALRQSAGSAETAKPRRRRAAT
jgi:predicted transcriptional regulator